MSTMEAAPRAICCGCIAIVLGAFGLLSSAAAQYADDLPTFNQDEVGVHYFGSAKDDKGKPVSDVTFLLSSTKGNFIFTTDADGRFRGTLPLELPISAVTPKCWRQGYDMVKVMKRPGTLAAERPTVQVDCTLRRSAAN